MASSPDTAAQAALLSAAFAASKTQNLDASEIKREEFSPLKSEPKIEIKEESPHEEVRSEPTVPPNDPKTTESNDSSVDMAEDELMDASSDRDAQGIDWRPLRSRSFLTDAQVGVLTAQFKRNPFPSKYELSALAEQIGVNKRVVQVGGHLHIMARSLVSSARKSRIGLFSSNALP